MNTPFRPPVQENASAHLVLIEDGASYLADEALAFGAACTTTSVIVESGAPLGARAALRRISALCRGGLAVQQVTMVVCAERPAVAPTEQRWIRRALLARALVKQVVSNPEARLTFLVAQNCERDLRHKLFGLVEALLAELGPGDGSVSLCFADSAAATEADAGNLSTAA